MGDMSARDSWRGRRARDAREGKGAGPVSGRGQADTADPGDVRPAASPGGRPPGLAPDMQVPRLLQQAAAWSWRLLLVVIVIYLGYKAASALRLVVLPLIAALLLAALLQPLTSWLRRAGMPSLAATWCTVLATVVFLAGLVTLLANRISADYPTLVTEVSHTGKEVQTYLAGPPFHLNSARLQQFSNEVVHFLVQHKTDIAGSVLNGGKIFLELTAGLVLMIFITFFLIKDGALIWSFVVSGLQPEARRRADNAGAAAWRALVNYVRGTAAVAAIHALFLGAALWIIGIPLLVPFIILVFLAAFVPLIGILVVGALAIVVTLATKGWIAAVVLIAVFLVENQIESHLLQPLLIGRIVKLHPLAIILALAAGGIVAGIPGAIVAVPMTAVIFFAWPFLRQEQQPGPPPGAG
jgi:predicted PurR-regulated permease PerM